MIELNKKYPFCPIIGAQEANKKVIALRKGAFIQGCKDFQTESGYWPIKVPVYERCAWDI